MCRPMPPTILPTVILVCACAAPLPNASVITAARAAGRKILMVILPRPACAGGCPRKPYTSAGRHVELGRHVLHLLQRRLQQRSREEMLHVGQRLVRRPLLGGDHGLAARFENVAEQFLW